MQKKVDTIFHIADIHVRNLKRHKEYRLVFDKLYAEIESRKTDNSMIVVAGDIVHSKLELSPEVIDVTSQFFKKLTGLCDTIVITGNHDTNLNNTYRLDALSPIIDNLNIDNLYYHKDSGVYDHGDVSFIVWSIFDDEDTYIRAKDVNTTNTKIGIYHGPVDSARTDVGFVIHNNKVKVDMMDGYDMFLLGDIHSFQYLNDAETIAFSSSLIQQNHGESLKNHGMLVWDVASRTSEFVEIQNEYGFYTLEIDNGKVPTVHDMPKNPRLRIKIANTDMADIKKVLTRIRKKYNVDEFTVIRTDTLSKQKNDSNGHELQYTGVHDVEHQNHLIKEYVGKYYADADADVIDKLYDINRELNSRIKDEDVVRNIQWFPKSFEFSNMFSYGENNKIDFSTLDGITGLFASNASGKSSIFDALSFCIFDKCSRTYKADQILNNNKNDFSCKFNFEIDGVDYYIHKVGIKQKQGNVKVNLDFYRIGEDGVIENMNGEQRRDTNSNIRQYLGTYEDFIFTCLSLQGNNSIFTEMSQSERKDLLAQLMGLTIFDKLYMEASDEVRDMTSLIRKFKRDDFTQELAQMECDGSTLLTQLDDITTRLHVLRDEFDTLDDELREQYEAIVSIDGVDTDIDNLNRNVLSVTNAIKSHPGAILRYEALVSSSTDELQAVECELKDAHLVGDAYNSHKTHEINYNDTVHLYNKTESALLHTKKSLTKIKESLDLEINDECASCIVNADKFSKDFKETSDKIDKLTDSLGELSGKKDTLEALVDPTVERRWFELKTKHLKFKELTQNISYYKRQITNTHDMITAGHAQIKRLNELIDRYYLHESSIKRNKITNTNITELQNKKSRVKLDITAIEKVKDEKTKKLGSVETKIRTILDSIDEVKDLEQKLRIYEYYLDSVKRDGIPYELIQKALPVMEDDVNNILQQIVDFSINIDIHGKSINAKIVYDNKEWPLELASGMERFIAGLAIRVSLMNISNLPRPNFLILDEGLGVLDSDNLNSMFMLFQYLKSQFKFVVVISHLDSVRDMVNDFIEIKKENGFSKLEHF